MKIKRTFGNRQAKTNNGEECNITSNENITYQFIIIYIMIFKNNIEK